MNKEAYLVRALRKGAVQCQVCEHYCAIQPGEIGQCGVRRNEDGVLVSTVYGDAVAVNLDPVEKKPLYHFLPGAPILSIGTLGCNLHCSFCQNWTLSQQKENGKRRRDREILPQALIDTCRRYGAAMIAYTYNEPTVFFEYSYDTARLAHENAIRNIYVSNGYMSPAMLEMIAPYLDGINVDLKSFDDDFYRTRCQGRLEPVKRNIRTIAQETDIWIEVTTLLIPGLNDSDEEIRALAGWLAEVDPEMPWHISAFHPDYRLLDRPPTSQAGLARAYEMGKEAGLEYVYVGNVADADRSATHCPQCGELLIRRRGYDVRETWQQRGSCGRCNHAVPGVWM